MTRPKPEADAAAAPTPERGPAARPAPGAGAGQGVVRQYLCREPWESYYILRRGILPCCHGEKPIAPMAAWATAWNSPALQEMRSFLARGELSPYCRRSLGCPIVQRELARERGGAEAARAAGVDPRDAAEARVQAQAAGAGCGAGRDAAAEPPPKGGWFRRLARRGVHGTRRE
jgi:hypothetical protein